MSSTMTTTMSTVRADSFALSKMTMQKNHSTVWYEETRSKPALTDESFCECGSFVDEMYANDYLNVEDIDYDEDEDEVDSPIFCFYKDGNGKYYIEFECEAIPDPEPTIEIEYYHYDQNGENEQRAYAHFKLLDREPNDKLKQFIPSEIDK
jgi:hypothetical protein